MSEIEDALSAGQITVDDLTPQALGTVAAGDSEFADEAKAIIEDEYIAFPDDHQYWEENYGVKF